MRPVSDRYKATVTSSHRLVTRARLVTAGQTGTNPSGIEIPVTDGDVKCDASAEVRSSLELETTASWPASPSDALTPYGPEVFVERGVVYGDGVREWVSLGYHRIQSVDQDDAPNGPIRITGQDRMAGIIHARMLAPRQYAASAALATVVSNLVWEVYPTVNVFIGGVDMWTAIGSTQIVERDRYAFLLTIAQSFGGTIWFDHNGDFRMGPPPNPGAPVATIGHGRRGVLVRMSRSLNDEGVHNAWVAEGEQLGDAAPAYGVAYDLDPDSPTRWGGPFGPRPTFFSSSFIKTDAQAVTAAEAMRDRQIGTPYNVSFGLVPNVALEVNDPVTITSSDTGQPEIHVLDKLSYPLGPEAAMTGATRLRGWSA